MCIRDSFFAAFGTEQATSSYIVRELTRWLMDERERILTRNLVADKRRFGLLLSPETSQCRIGQVGNDRLSRLGGEKKPVALVGPRKKQVPILRGDPSV